MTQSSSARWRIATIFFLHGFAGAVLHTRIPDLQLAAGLNDAGLGLVLMGAPLGSMAMFPIASRAIEHHGTRNVTLVAFVALLLSIPLMTLVTNPVVMFVLMALNGAGGALSAMTFNVEADRVEASLGRRIMNSCHGAWSIGYLIASAAGAGIRGAGVSPALHLWSVTVVLSVVCVWALLTSVPAPARAFSPQPRRKFVLPSLLLLSLVAVGLGAELLEGASRIWATILLRDSFDVPAWLESSALPAMVVAMATGRLLADTWIDRFGPVPVARVLLAIAFAGVLAIATAGHPIIVILGFAVAGAGVCVIYPLSVSAAARMGTGPASQNVASLTLVIQIVMLIAPMFTGLIAEQFGVRAAFGALLPLLALGFAMAGSLGDRAPATLASEKSA